MAAPTQLRLRIQERLRARGSYQRWVLLAALSGMFANTFPFTVLAVSLGTIADEFGASEATMAWVITAPILFSAVSLPILGKMGDLRGHRVVFLCGSGLATVIAFVSASAWSALTLIALRTLAAIVGSTTQPSSMALIFRAFGPVERTRAMGWWSMVGAGSPALGLIVGGPLVDLLGWRVVFLLQGCFATFALLFAWLVLSETPRQRVSFDLAGALTLALAVGGLMLGLGNAPQVGWLAVEILAPVAVGLLFAVLFVAVERRSRVPLLPLDLFVHRNFTAPILATSTMGAAYMGAFVIAPWVLLDTFGLSVAAASAIMLLRTLTLSIASPFGGRLGANAGERAAAVVGTVLIALSMVMLALGALGHSLVALGAGLVLQGLGQGLCLPSLTSAVASSVPESNLGIATAANRLLNQVGSAFGITLMTMAYGTPQRGVLMAFSVGAVLAILAIVAASYVVSTPAAGSHLSTSEHGEEREP